MPKVYRSIHDGTLVETADPGADRVNWSHAGGGLVYSSPGHIFRAMFKPHTEPETWHWGWVHGDWLFERPALKAYISDRRWNGWAKPMLTAGAAERMASWFPQQMSFVPALEAFVVDQRDMGEAPIVIQGEAVEAPNVKVTLIDLSGIGWCWEEVDVRIDDMGDAWPI